MKKIFNESFFKFVLGFIAILTLSFVITFAVDQLAQRDGEAQPAAVIEAVE